MGGRAEVVLGNTLSCAQNRYDRLALFNERRSCLVQPRNVRPLGGKITADALGEETHKLISFDFGIRCAQTDGELRD